MKSLAALGGCYLANSSFRAYRRFYPYFTKLNPELIHQSYDPSNYIFITGSTDGIGKEFSKVFYGNLKFNVILHGRSQEKLENLKQELETQFASKQQSKPQIHTFNLDLNQNFDQKYFQQEIDQQNLKDLKIIGLVNNAGTACLEKFHLTSEENVNNVLNVNLHSSMRFINYFLHQDKHKHRFIINISTFLAENGHPYTSIYAASKKFISTVLKNTMYEQENVEVFNITPYRINTKLISHKQDKFTRTPEEVAINSVKILQKGNQGTYCGTWQHELFQYYYRFRFNVFPNKFRAQIYEANKRKAKAQRMYENRKRR